MRDYKKALVAGALAMSMLVGQAGHTDITASAKTKYDNEIDLFDDTGEVISFPQKFNTKHMRDTQWHISSDKAFWGEEGVSCAMSSDGYYYISKGIVIMSSPITVYDNTNSVKKITVDGKKSYKLNKSKVIKDTYNTFYDFGDNNLHDLGVKVKSSPKLKYSTLSEGKHTLVVKDKHGHKVTYKVWKDTKKPKTKDYKKGNKWITKATDKGSGIGEITIFYKNGNEKVKKYTSYKKTVKLTFSNKEWKKLDGILVKDRAGNDQI